MKKLLLIILFFLISCTSQNSAKNDFNFSHDMDFDEFKIKLEEYAQKNPYPNIDN